eukprot:GABV01000177.1.p1 GENE.GABV01000177.1~~GABV01000177.1.p1  ORF type:complete len:479 (-),score=190.75 GABV01000177.1:21-1457(-)
MARRRRRPRRHGYCHAALFSTQFLNSLAQREPGRLPFVVLLTDGAVANERDICTRLQQETQQGSPVRVLTFGIGKYCNWYFLKMAAQVSRGFSAAAAFQEQLFPKIQQMMMQASTPVLTEVQLEMALQSVEVYPFPIPDLFAGRPLTVAGKFSGNFPQSIMLTGKLGNGEVFRQEVSAQFTNTVPLNKVFLKQRMDLLIARQWMLDSAEIKDEIVQVSTAESFPSPFTTMVAYETTPQKKEEQEKKDEKADKKKRSGGGVSGKAVAAMAVGGIVALGAAAFIFGDPAATASNVGSALSGVGGDIGDFFGGLELDGCCCDGGLEALSCGMCESCDGLLESVTCGGCDGGCGDLVPCDVDCSSVGDVLSCGICGEALDGCGQACGSCDIGGLFESCTNVCGDFFGNIGGCVGDCCGNLGEYVGSVTNLCGGCSLDACPSCDSCPNPLEMCGSCDGICEGMGELLKGVCGMLTSVCDICED